MSTIPFNRRGFMAACSSLGLGSTLFPGVLWGMMQQPAPKPPSATPAEAPKQEPTPPPAISKEMIRDAVAVAGLKFDDAQIEMMSQGLNDRLRTYKTIWDLKIPNDVAPALVFDPVVPGMTLEH